MCASHVSGGLYLYPCGVSSRECDFTVSHGRLSLQGQVQPHCRPVVSTELPRGFWGRTEVPGVDLVGRVTCWMLDLQPVSSYF